MSVMELTPADQMIADLHDKALRNADRLGLTRGRRPMYVHIYTAHILAERLVRAETRIRELEEQQ